MKKKATHYFKTDLERLLKRYGFYISVLGVAMALFFALEDYGVINNSVMDTYISGTEMSGMMLVYIFCAFPYAPVIVEDIENKYVRCQLICCVENICYLRVFDCCHGCRNMCIFSAA